MSPAGACCRMIRRGSVLPATYTASGLKEPSLGVPHVLLAMAGIGQCLAFLLRWEWGWRWWQQFGRRRRARRSAAAPGHRGAQRRPDRFATVSRPQRLPAGGWRRPMGLPAAGRCRPAAGQHPRDSQRVGGSDHRDRGRRPASRRQHHLPPRAQRLGAAPAAAAWGVGQRQPHHRQCAALCQPVSRHWLGAGAASGRRLWPGPGWRRYQREF